MDGMKTLISLVAVLTGFATLKAAAENKVDFVKDIQPILQKSCVECHGAEKDKGKLRLHTKEGAFKRDPDVIVIEPGQADKSELYRRIILPADHDDVMPNKGDVLTKAQTDLIRDWINQGAAWPVGIVIGGAAAKTGEHAAAADATAELPLPDYKPTAAELKAVKTLESMGVPIRPIAANLGWREVNFRVQSPEAGAVEKALAILSGVTGLYELNLGGVKIKDADLANIKGLTNLRRLHLENTPVTDAGLAHVKGLVNLNYLNLYGTAVTDAGLEHLKGMTHLKNLYLWQSKTTEAGVAKLKKALPHVDISTGWEFKEVETKVENKDAKPEEKK